MDHLRQQERRRGEEAGGARRAAGFGAGTDPVDHGLRLGPPMSHATGCWHGMLRGRYVGAGRRTMVERYRVPDRGRRGVRGTRHSEARLERVAGLIRGLVVLRSTSQRNPSGGTVDAHHRRRGSPGETPDEVPGPDHRQRMDVCATFRASGPKGDSRSQRLMRLTAEHWRSGTGSSPTLRGSGPVASPLRSPRLGRRSVGESSQLDLGEETA